MYELKPSINAGFGRLHARRVVEVDVHLDPVLELVVVDHAARVRKTDGVDLPLRELHEHRRVLGGRGPRDGNQRLLVVDVKRA